jgi:hypothetical protein
LLLSSLLVVLGMQLFALGLLGELIIFTHARDIKDYQIDEVIRYPDKLPAALPQGGDLTYAGVRRPQNESSPAALDP